MSTRRRLRSLGRRRLPPAVRVDSDVGPLLLPAADRMIAVTLARDGAWEPGEGALLRRLVEPGMTVLDVGAHCGYFTRLLAALVGAEGKVVAIEASAENFALLEANLRSAGVANAVAVNAAAWSSSGRRLPLSLSEENSGDHRAYRWDSGRRTVEVEALAIDDLDPPLQRLDLIKLDTQATEHIVIEGMLGTIERLRPRLLVEFWPLGIRELGDDPLAVAARYLELGLEIEVVEPAGSGGTPSPAQLVGLAERSPTEFCNLLLTPAG